MNFQGRTAQLLREPLVYFFLMGALIFGLAEGVAALRGADAIVVPKSVRAATAERLRAALGRAATEPELRAQLQRWVNEEMLYREGVRLGLERGDAQIRDIVVHKALGVTQMSLPRPVATDAELERWFHAHRDRYTIPVLFDLEVLRLSDSADRMDMTQALRMLSHADVAPSSLGTMHVYRHVPRSNLAQSYGSSFAEALRELPPGEWCRVPGGDAGLLVKVDRIQPEIQPEFGELKSRVREDWRKETETQQMERMLEQLRKKYRIQLEHAS